MNIIESRIIGTPDGDMGECSIFTIDDISIPFTLQNIMTYGENYTLSLWVKSEVEGGLIVHNKIMPSTEYWNKYSHEFVADETDLDIFFNTVGTYVIYHPQLERGNLTTDWKESPLDTADKINKAQSTADEANSKAEAFIEILNDAIKMIVTDGENNSLMTQTASGGWTFCMAETEEKLKEASEALSKLDLSTKASLEELSNVIKESTRVSSYVKINEEGDTPYIDLGTIVDNELGEFRLHITTTALEFVQDGNTIAYLSNQRLHIRKAAIEEELYVGGFDQSDNGEIVYRGGYVLQEHGERNNLGFVWKGVTN